MGRILPNEELDHNRHRRLSRRQSELDRTKLDCRRRQLAQQRILSVVL